MVSPVYATDPPHNMAYNISCLSCHVAHKAGTAGFLLTNTAATIDNLCQSCHNGTIADFVEGHSSTTTTAKYGTWHRSCTNCHNPHSQEQWRSWGTQAYIFTGTVSALSSTQLTDTSANWSADQWKDSILVPDTATITNSIYPDTNRPPIFMITSNNATTLTVKIVRNTAGLTASTSVGASYSIFYGRLIRSRMDTVWRNNIYFYNNSGPHSFADGTTFTTVGSTNYYTSNICETCHTRTNHHRYKSGTTFTPVCSGQPHHDGQNCTTCHPHSNGFAFTESHGSQNCIGCHKSLFDTMNTTANFHHYMNNTQATYPLLSVPAQLGGTADTNRRCLMCHADHNVFSPEINTVSGGRGYNLRTSIALVPTSTSTSTFANTDFVNSSSTPGICLSCHFALQTKSYAQPDTTTTTPYIPTKDTIANQVAMYGASAHNYTVASFFTALTQTGCNNNNAFNANCTKCHNDTLYPKSSMKAQISSYPSIFGLHNSLLSSMLAPLGLWLSPYLLSGLPSSPLEEKFCYQCHSSNNPNAPSYDYYGVAAMNTADTSIDTIFNNNEYIHPITATSYLHKPYDEGLAYNNGTLSGANRHVACTDCHNPHAAETGLHIPGTNLVGGATKGVWGVTVTPSSSIYITGTATFNNNAVTGNGTLWLGVVVPGWFIKSDCDINGIWYEVTQVNSNTSLTVSPAYSNNNSANCPYTYTLVGPPVYTRTENSKYGYQICLKCHSDYAYGSVPPLTPSQVPFAPYGSYTNGNETNVALDFNPNLYGYHPIFAEGRNRPPAGANPNWGTSASCAGGSYGRKRLPNGSCSDDLSNTFVDGWYYTSTVTCSDCHGSSIATDPAGPHGSANKWITVGVNQNVTVTLANGTVTYPNQPIFNTTNYTLYKTTFCFNCHRADVYMFNGNTYPAYSNLSRVDHPPNGLPRWARGRHYQTTAWGSPCFLCHGGDSLGGIHGSNREKNPNAGGINALGTRLLNGAALIAVTRPSTTQGFTCWVKSSSDAVQKCAEGHTGRVGNRANYNYDTAYP